MSSCLRPLLGRAFRRSVARRLGGCLERNGQSAGDLADHGAGGQAGQTPDLAAEMGLIGISRRERQRRQLRRGRPPGNSQEALETEDAVQLLRAIAEDLMAAPPQAALAD